MEFTTENDGRTLRVTFGEGVGRVMKRARELDRDWERSSFQHRPAYRYIRKTDRLPPLGRGAKLALVHLFNPTGQGDWWISEYDPETRMAYGVARIQEAELGYISIPELVAYRGKFGLPIERDLHWQARPLEALLREARVAVWRTKEEEPPGRRASGWRFG